MLLRKIKIFILGLITVLATSSAAAFSYFSFVQEQDDQKHINSGNGLDNIKENYSFGAEEPNYKQYNLYFFPSSFYADASLVQGEFAPAAGTLPNAKYIADYPERVFGYIEPRLNDNREPIYDTSGNLVFDRYIFDQNSFKVDNTGNFDEGYINHLNRDVFNNNNNTYLVPGGTTRHDVYKNGDQPGKTEEVKYQELMQYASTANLGETSYDVHDYNVGPFNNPKYKQDWHFMGRTHKRNDRFGFWSQLKEGQGRYLPEKITAHGSLPSSLFETLTTQPFTSMEDARTYYNFGFSHWAVLKGGKPYSNFRQAFDNADVINIFDIMKSLDTYADAEGNIRLFPAFSNGKHYNTNNLDNGGKDAAKVNFVYSDKYLAQMKKQKNVILPPEKYFTYVADKISPSQNNALNGNGGQYMLIKNVPLAYDMYDELQIRITLNQPLSQPAAWNTPWMPKFVYDKATINKICSTYGDGTFNLYLFIGNPDKGKLNTNNSYWRHDFYSGTIPSYINQPLNDIGNKVTGPNGFPRLLNKNLVPFKTANGEYFKYADETYPQEIWHGDTWDSCVTLKYCIRPIAIYIEKSTEIRLFQELNLGTLPYNFSTGQYETQLDFNTIDNEIIDSLNGSLNFVNGDEVYYGSINNEGQFVPSYKDSENNPLPIIKETPYVYYIKNVDFTDINSLYFTIRMASRYFDINFNEKPDDALKNKVVLKSLNQDNEVVYQQFDSCHPSLLDSDNTFFTIDKVKSLAPESDGSVRNVFKLINDEAKGIYDFVLVKFGQGSNFYLYQYRHMNIFTKVFFNDVGITLGELNGQEYFFADHKHLDDKGNLIQNKEVPIWESNFFIGRNLTGNYKSNISGYGLFKNDIYKAMTAKGYKTATLFDHVTKLPVCYFVINGSTLEITTATEKGDNAKIFKILKNYILYLKEGVHMTSEAAEAAEKAKLN